MRETRITMGMPGTIEIIDDCSQADIDEVFDWYTHVDETFSTYKETSEISRINAGQISEDSYSAEMREILAACEKTKQETKGFFDISHNGKLDPSGYVKGWAIQRAAEILRDKGFHSYYVEIAGDIQTIGCNAEGKPWTVGIRNPFNRQEIIKRLSLQNKGIATSGTSIRGQHIYNPHQLDQQESNIVSLTAIADKIVDADRFATAAFAMGQDGIAFIAETNRLEGYMIDADGQATFTPGFNRYLHA